MKIEEHHEYTAIVEDTERLWKDIETMGKNRVISIQAEKATNSKYPLHIRRQQVSSLEHIIAAIDENHRKLSVLETDLKM